MDPSDIGRLGALSLLRTGSTESIVTSYPIDDEELTIGRDQSCSLRLYYPAVSALHAKITFVERKAFLVVLGTNGVLLDDSPLFPAAPTAPGPTTVPLQNNSIIEIHKKRFRFTYPPKHLRPALINTPTQATPIASRRPLRLSMIASAHVFTPRPSHDPQENLRILQTPLRTPFSREQEEIVLVHSNTPQVVEEDKDLVILDEVEPEPLLPLPLPVMPQYPVTPVRRHGRPSLHRAVLIRSAQRAALQREIQQEEEELDAEEVEETIGAIAEEGEDEIEEIPPPQGQREVSGWRKSLDLVRGSLEWALRGVSVEPKEEEQEATLDAVDEEHDEEMEVGAEPDYDYHEDEEETYDHQYEEEHDTQAEPQRALGQFMSPQIPRIAHRPRLSLGVAPDTGPRRVRVVAPWKVSEIQVPTTVKEEGTDNVSAGAVAPPSTPRSPVKREKLTDEEREAIRARRRSALATPDNFFKGQTPGSRRTLFPALAPLPSPSFTQPAEAASTSSESQSSAQDAASVSSPSTASSSSSVAKVEEEEDTAVLLARMKQMVEGVKQRQSLGRQSLSVSPRKREGGFSLLAPNHASTHRPSRILIEEDEGDALTQDDHEDQPTTQTPQMADLRHIFSRPQGDTSTPVLTGLREMFRVEPVHAVETPRMDGVMEMLSTPAGYRAPPTEEHDPENEGEKDDDEPVEELPARNARGKRTPATRIARRTAVPQSAPPKSTRAASQALEESELVESEMAPEVRGARRTRARTADGAVGQVPRATRGKVTKPATPDPEEDEEEADAQPAAAPTRGTRRTRQTTDSSSSQADDAATADAKPTRKTRAKTPTPAAGASTTKTTVVRRGTRAKPFEVTEDENEEDPLDSLPRERTASADAAAPAPRARRGGRSKLPIKKEDVEETVPPMSNEDVEPSAAPTRTTRARRTPVPKVPTSSGTAGRGGRTRSATASSVASEPAIPEDKENTPEASTEDDAEEAKGAGSKTRGASKGTRAAGKASGKSTPEVNEEPGVPAAPATKTRAGRTRAARA